MPDTPVSSPPQLTAQQLSAVLLEVTGDLDKAQVLQQRMPSWLLTARPELLEQLQNVHARAAVYETNVSAILRRIKALDQFCVDEMTAGLLRKFGVSPDVKRDYLWLPHTGIKIGPASFPIQRETTTIETRTLLQAATQNFSEEQAQGASFPAGSCVRRGTTDALVPEISVAAFARFCRELDLGRRYQLHLQSALNHARPLADEALHNADASEIKQLKTYDMAADVLLAYMRGEISEGAYKWLLGFTRQGANLSKATMQNEKYGAAPMLFQGLDVHDACLWGIVVFSRKAIDQHPETPCIVYMPGEPYRPIFEYSTFAQFTAYLTAKLQVKQYAAFFSRYLDEASRTDFFSRFSQDQSLGQVKPLAINTGLFQFFFNSFIGKLQKDSRVLAVPTLDFDQTVRDRRYDDYLSAGLNLLNIAGFFVPVIGELMMGVALGQMLGEIYDGVQDWRHEDRAAALTHLRNVVESVAMMATFAAGGKIAGAVRRAGRENLDYFDDLEAVPSSDGQTRLWRASLRPYTQRLALEGPDALGMYWHQGEQWIKIDGRSYRVRYDRALGQWRIQHPSRAQAFAPPLSHNGAGGWRASHESTQQWGNSLYGLRRLDPQLEAVDDTRLEQVRQRCDVQLEQLQQWGQDNLKLPARVRDSVLRSALDQKISDLIWHLEKRQPFTPENIALQLDAVPLMPGWPKGRYLEVSGADGEPVARYPADARIDDELSVLISQDQVHEGSVLVGVVEGLYPAELDSVLGDAPAAKGETSDEALARRLAQTLSLDRAPLHQRLYAASDQPVGAEQARLIASAPGLPAKVAEELIDGASSVDRIHLRDARRVPLTLRQAAREAARQIQRDRLETPRPPPAERPVTPGHCMLADPPQPATPTGAQRGMIRKLRDLYPFFSETEARTLLDSLGHDDLERATAVRLRQQQLSRLDDLLKTWTRHDAEMKKLPGRLDDYRHSRRQVADRLRNAWRRQTRLPTESGVSMYSLKLDNMRVGKLPALPPGIDFGHVRLLSLKNMQLDNDVAYFLKAFNGLNTLEMDNNQLTWLPEMVSHMPSLEHLSLAQNRINLTDPTTRKLQAMRGLRSLDLSSNPLGETPSVSQMDNLQRLNLRNTQARELPGGLLTRLHLEDANLRENNIIELPSELFTAPVAVTETINLRLNPVSTQSRQDLAEYRRRTGVGMGLQEDDISLLSEQRSRQAWLEGDSAAEYLRREGVWESLQDEWQSSDFFAVLRQLVNTAHYRQVRHDLVRRVWTVIDAAAEDTELRELLFSISRGEPNCVDAAAYSFSEMEVTVMLHNAMRQAGVSQPNVASLLKLGRGLFRLEQLDSISDVFSQRKNIVDHLAVRLVYRSGLAKTLDLPGQPESITYREVGGVTQEDLAEAVAQVTTREMSSDFARFMARRDFWLEYLKRQFAAEFSTVRQTCTTRLAALDSTSTTYDSAVRTVQVDHQRAHEQLVERLTNTVMQEAETPQAPACAR